jgi:nucleoid-associated protein YgaU
MATTHARTPETPRTTIAGGGRSEHDGSGRPTHLRLVTASGPARRPPAREAAPRRPSDGRRQPPLRLTQRGQAVLRGLVVLVMLGLMAGAALTMAHRADAADRPARSVVVARHVVLPGETLWGIATSVAPNADPRDTVARIVEFNALTSSAIHAGQTLAIPPGLPGR